MVPCFESKSVSSPHKKAGMIRNKVPQQLNMRVPFLFACLVSLATIPTQSTASGWNRVCGYDERRYCCQLRADGRYKQAEEYCITHNCDYDECGWQSGWGWGGGGRPTEHPTSNAWGWGGSSKWEVNGWSGSTSKPTKHPTSWGGGGNPIDWTWNGWSSDAWTGDGWNWNGGKQTHSPTAAPSAPPTSSPTTVSPTPSPATSSPTTVSPTPSPTTTAPAPTVVPKPTPAPMIGAPTIEPTLTFCSAKATEAFGKNFGFDPIGFGSCVDAYGRDYSGVVVNYPPGNLTNCIDVCGCVALQVPDLFRGIQTVYDSFYPATNEICYCLVDKDADIYALQAACRREGVVTGVKLNYPGDGYVAGAQVMKDGDGNKFDVPSCCYATPSFRLPSARPSSSSQPSLSSLPSVQPISSSQPSSSSSPSVASVQPSLSSSPTYCEDPGFGDIICGKRPDPRTRSLQTLRCYDKSNLGLNSPTDDVGSTLKQVNPEGEDELLVSCLSTESFITKESISTECENEMYDVAVSVVPGPHFFLLATKSPDSSSNVICPTTFAFDTVNFDKKIAAPYEEDLKALPSYELKTAVKLTDLLAAEESAESPDPFNFHVLTNSCVHYASRIWRPLGVDETEDLGDFIVANIMNDENILNLWEDEGEGEGVSVRRLAWKAPLVQAVIEGEVKKVVYSQLHLKK
jgi:hypothetical protein